MNSPTPSRFQPGAAANEGWRPPTDFDEYHLVRQIGRGANGLVYAAQDKLLDRVVAIKFILAIDPNAGTRLLIEARAAGRIQHPNVATVYRVGELDGRPYLVSEFVHGNPLDELARPVKTPSRALELALGLARGLAAAHRLGVLHRDLKPSNAIVADTGEVKLVDFGLAKFIESIEPQPVQPPDISAAVALPRLTHAGAIVGTPYYMAPEMWRGEAATRRSDVYSLGVLLYEICSGDVPFGHVSAPDLPTMAQSSDPPPLLQVARHIPPAFAAIIDRCVKRNPEERFSRADELASALEQLLPNSHAEAVPEGNPYRGLEAFGAEHRSLFFGRVGEIRAVLERLRGDPFVLIAGDSGVGKSSLAAAGVVPRMLEGALADGRVWAHVRTVPGRRPLAALVAALASALAIAEEEMRQTVANGPVEVARAVRRRLRNSAGLLLYIDQLEELVTLSPLSDAAPAAEILGELCAGVPGVRLLATARSDFLTRLAALPGFGPDLERALYLLRPLSIEGLRQVIVGPADSKGVRFESDELVEALVSSASRAEGGLPLLQFTLAELWDARDRDVIAAASLDAIGGVEGALARHADGVIDRMLPAQRKAARSVLLRLVTIDGTRARRTEEELFTSNRGAARAAIEALVRGRLVLARQGEGGSTFEVAHEALLAGWGRLRKWLEEEADSRAILYRLETAAAEWERLGRTRDALWGSAQLAEWAALGIDPQAPREKEFIRESRSAVKRKRRLRIAAGVAVPIAGLIAYGAFQTHARYEVAKTVNAALGEAQAAFAVARSKETEARALENQALALFDARKKKAAEEIWSRVLERTAEIDRNYSRASHALESALALDSKRKDVRGLFGDLILARALDAEGMHRPVDRDEVAAHLMPYDDGNERRRVWIAPAHLGIRTAPASAHVVLNRYDTDETGRRRAVSVADLGLTPVASMRIEQGSYLLLISMPGHPDVRYPFVANRSENLDLTIELPQSDAIPNAFIYIPAGRFLFGSSIDEGRRDFYGTTPLHEVTTGSYLIARNETTWGEWIEFLRALPPEQQKRHMPIIDRADHGGVRLEPLHSGEWQLTLQPTTKSYTARSGQNIVYDDRSLRAQQNWLRMPAMAISWDDAQAYVAWLRRTGRVPHARLCTEYEWERAARGADDREYPQGDHLEADDANHDATYGKQPLAFGPDEVGSHLGSRSPFGADDMTGNVWEWTSSVITDGEHALRGSSYYYGKLTARVPNRFVAESTARDPNVGVRVCADLVRR